MRASVVSVACEESESFRSGSFEEPRRGLRALACVALIIIGCGFSYSVGWQRGSLDAIRGADARYHQLNRTIMESPVLNPDRAVGTEARGRGYEDLAEAAATVFGHDQE